MGVYVRRYFILILLICIFSPASLAEIEIIESRTVKGKKGLEAVVISFVSSEYSGGWKYVDEKNLTRNIPVFKDLDQDKPQLPADTLAAILRTSYHNVYGGYKDGSFKPDKHITRAEFVTIVVRNFVEDYNELLAKRGENHQLTTGFKDMSGHWALSNVVIAKERKWVTGYTDNTFKPDNTITHAEALVVLNEVAQGFGQGSQFPYSFGEKFRVKIGNDDSAEDTTIEKVLSSGESYADLFKRWDWAYPAIKNFAVEEIISHKSIVDREFYPSYKLTRAEAAVLIDALNCHFEEQRLKM